MTIVVSKFWALGYTLAVVIASSILTFVVGTAYLDSRIQKGVRESEIIDARVDEAFRGLCGILLGAATPAPKPPTPEDVNTPDPETPYGRALAEYNRKLVKRQADGLAAVNAAIEEYDCRR